MGCDCAGRKCYGNIKENRDIPSIHESNFDVKPKKLSESEKKEISNVFGEETDLNIILNEIEKYKILILEKKDYSESEKIIDFFDDLFFGKEKKEKELKILYKDETKEVMLSFSKFNEREKFKKEYDLVISFTKDKNEAISIISEIKGNGFIFPKGHYLKKEILEKLEGLILSNQIILTNHYLSKLNEIILKKKKSEENTFSESQSISYSSIKSEDRFIEILKCPISGEIMEDPVMSPGGHTYEKKYIEKWIEQKGLSPLTKNILKKDDLRINYSVKNMIENYYSFQTKNNTSVKDLKNNLLINNN